MADDSIISYSDLIGDDGTFKDLAKDIEKLEKQLIDLAKTTKKAFKSVNPNDAAQIEKLEKQVRELTQANKNLAKAKEVVRNSQKKQIELTKEELIQREALKLEKREALRLAKAEAQILKAEKNTIQSLRAQLSKATIEWSKFTAEELKSTDSGKKALKAKKDLTAQLKKLEKATGDNRREVGNYGLKLKGLRKDLMRVFVGRTIIDGVRRLGGAFGDLVEKFRDSNEVIGGIGSSFDRASNALQFAGVKILEFLAPAIEYVANLISDLPAFFAGTSAAVTQFATNVRSKFSNIGNIIEKFGLQAKRAITFDSNELAAIDAQLAVVNRRIQNVVDSRTSITDAFDKAFRETKDAQADFAAEQEKEEKEAAEKKKREERKQLQDRLKQQKELRIKALEKIQKELRKLEIENIEDKRKQLEALEDERYKNEAEARESQLKELEVLFKDNQTKLLEIADLRRDLDEQSEKKHKDNLLKIEQDYLQEKFDKKRAAREKEREQDAKAEADRQKQLDEDEKERSRRAKERLKKKREDRKQTQKEEEEARIAEIEAQEEATEELLTQIGETANKIGAEVVKLLDKQADLAKDNVNEQVNNLDRARERAAQGLESNIAFEEKELARRQAEQQKKEKQAQQAAKLLTLFNLVSAYAQSGDENALFRGLADFAILEAVGAGLQGFYEGTEDTGTANNPLDNKGGRLAILHDNERVVTKAQNMLLGGMSNDDLVQNALIGSQMSDNFNPMSSTQINAFAKQKEDFVNSFKTEQRHDSNRELIREVKGLRQQIANQPNMSYELEKLYEGLYGLVKTEQKANYKKIQRQKLKPRF